VTQPKPEENNTFEHCGETGSELKLQPSQKTALEKTVQFYLPGFPCRWNRLATAHTFGFFRTTLDNSFLKQADPDCPSAMKSLGLKYPEWKPPPSLSGRK
jgi:hypothetical protein